MLGLCLMFSVTYYAQNYAGIIGGSLACIYNNHVHKFSLHATSPQLASYIANNTNIDNGNSCNRTTVRHT